MERLVDIRKTQDTFAKKTSDRFEEVVHLVESLDKKGDV